MLSAPAILSLDDAFDVELADRLARYETFNKHHYRPNTYLHKWWGRRCGSTFRLILKGLVDDPALRDYYAPGGLEGKLILDPMMGGGTTLHEAIRLGANVVGADIDPIPILQARATLSAVSLGGLEKTFLDILHGLRDDLGHLYASYCPECDRPGEFWHILYGLRRRCACREVAVVDSFVLRAETGGRTFYLCPDFDAVTTMPDCCGDGPPRAAQLVGRDVVACDRCGADFVDFSDIPYYARYAPLVVVGRCPTHGIYYRPFDAPDRQLLAEADVQRSQTGLPAEEFAVVPGDKSIQLINRGIHSYLDLFSSRQLLVISRAMDALPADPLPRLNLSLLLSTSLEFNSMLCGYKGVSQRRAGAVRHTFSLHAYSFPYTALETNPLYSRPASGTLRKLFYSRLIRGRRWAYCPQERLVDSTRPAFVSITGERDEGVEVAAPIELTAGPQRFYLHQGSSASLPLASGSVDAVVTDPPYYDSIQYSDLAAFFRVWLRRMLPDEANWDYDETASAVDPERMGQVSRYTELLGAIFHESGRVLRPDGRLVFTFHHWKAAAWAALTVALRDAGFVLANRYVVHAEHPISVHISNMKALTHDVVLVCAPRASGAGRLWELPPAMPRGDSFTFCEVCGGVLGWCLGQPDLTPAEIERIWENGMNSPRVFTDTTD